MSLSISAALAFVQTAIGWIEAAAPGEVPEIMRRLIQLVPVSLEPELLALAAEFEAAGPSGIWKVLKHLEAVLAAAALGLDPTKV